MRQKLDVTVDRSHLLSANASGGNRYGRGRKRKAVRHQARMLAKHRLEPMPGDRPVRIEVAVFKGRAGRYDPANLYDTVKPIVDGITDAGVLVDDDHKHVHGPYIDHGGVDAALGRAVRFELVLQSVGGAA